MPWRWLRIAIEMQIDGLDVLVTHGGQLLVGIIRNGALKIASAFRPATAFSGFPLEAFLDRHLGAFPSIELLLAAMLTPDGQPAFMSCEATVQVDALKLEGTFPVSVPIIAAAIPLPIPFAPREEVEALDRTVAALMPDGATASYDVTIRATLSRDCASEPRRHPARDKISCGVPADRCCSHRDWLRRSICVGDAVLRGPGRGRPLFARDRGGLWNRGHQGTGAFAPRIPSRHLGADTDSSRQSRDTGAASNGTGDRGAERRPRSDCPSGHLSAGHLCAADHYGCSRTCGSSAAVLFLLCGTAGHARVCRCRGCFRLPHRPAVGVAFRNGDVVVAVVANTMGIIVLRAHYW